jgi:hypothetical protein
LNLISYAEVLEGGSGGASIIPGDPATSLLIQKQTGETPHFGQLTEEELALVREWIEAGAPE